LFLFKKNYCGKTVKLPLPLPPATGPAPDEQRAASEGLLVAAETQRQE
jgi:hypothetical protein